MPTLALRPMRTHTTTEKPSRKADVPWLSRLRWAFLIAELLFVGWLMAQGHASLFLVLLVLAHGASNLLLTQFGTRFSESILVTLLLDVCVLTVLLRAGGGSSNPFAVVFLVQVTVAAVLLKRARMWLVVASAVVGYAALFVGAGARLMHAHHGDAFGAHLQGMWVAFSVTAVGIAGFVSRLASELEDERERADANARIMGMTALAAGAAHELATPLATIKTVVLEIEDELLALDRASDRHAGLARIGEDLALVRSQVDRSRTILDRLSSAAGELRGEAPTPMPLRDLERCVDGLPESLRARVEWRHGERASDMIDIPHQALVQALQALLHNALEASAPDRKVRVASEVHDGELRIDVQDEGAGMDAETLAHAADPFFTTKDPGHGMGLGLFLVQALVAHLGGRLVLRSSLGQGTTASLFLPAKMRRITEKPA